MKITCSNLALLLKLLLLFFIIEIVSTQILCAKTLKLCIADGYWYPISYIEDGQIQGIHWEIVKNALDNLGYKNQIIGLPYRRCAKYVENNKMDGMVSLAYQPNISSFIDFPPGVEKAKQSKWHIMQVDYIVVTPINDEYNFTGDIKSLPIPIRLRVGENLRVNFQKKGLRVETTGNDRANMLKLVRDGKGAVITTSVMAGILNNEPRIRNKIKIHKIPIVSQSYYFAFSKEAPISFEEKMQIWDEIKALRNDHVFILELFSKYEGMTQLWSF